MSSVASSVLARPTRWLGGLVLALLLLNAALVGWLWLAPCRAVTPQPPQLASGASFLADTLQLSVAQRVRYDTLQARYSRRVRPLAQSCRQSCQQYFLCWTRRSPTSSWSSSRGRRWLAKWLWTC